METSAHKAVKQRGAAAVALDDATTRAVFGSIHARLTFAHSSTDDVSTQIELRRSDERQERTARNLVESAFAFALPLVELLG